jgi:hypothetical protein
MLNKYYDILNIPPDATINEIHDLFYKRSINFYLFGYQLLGLGKCRLAIKLVLRKSYRQSTKYYDKVLQDRYKDLLEKFHARYREIHQKNIIKTTWKTHAINIITCIMFLASFSYVVKVIVDIMENMEKTPFS